MVVVVVAVALASPICKNRLCSAELRLACIVVSVKSRQQGQDKSGDIRDDSWQQPDITAGDQAGLLQTNS